MDLKEVVPDSWETIAPFSFPGMKGYCNCEGKFKKSCDPTKPEEKTCYKIEDAEKKTMNIWRDKKLIFRRFKKKEIEYVRRQKDGKEVCKGGFKKCTPVHCVKDYVSCPITHFWINKDKAQYVRKHNNIEKIDIGKDDLVVERHSDSQQIVNGFYLELNGMPCYNPNSSHKLVTKKGSSLAPKLGGYGCSKPSGENVQDYRRVDSIPLLDFFKDNGMNRYVDSIPNSELSHLLEEKVFLAARFKLFMGLSDLCQDFNIDQIYAFRIGI